MSIDNKDAACNTIESTATTFQESQPIKVSDYTEETYDELELATLRKKQIDYKNGLAQKHYLELNDLQREHSWLRDRSRTPLLMYQQQRLEQAYLLRRQQRERDNLPEKQERDLINLQRQQAWNRRSVAASTARESCDCGNPEPDHPTCYMCGKKC